jgi:glucose-6-phosphate 1-dehydrogenase
MRDRMNSLVIFVATGNLAKLETFPALVVVGRGVLDVPVVGVARSDWDLGDFREYATESLRLNGIDPGEAAALVRAYRRRHRRRRPSRERSRDGGEAVRE